MKRVAPRRPSWSVPALVLVVLLVAALVACSASRARDSQVDGGPTPVATTAASPAPPTTVSVPAVADVRSALRTQTVQQAHDVLAALVQRSGSRDPRYFSDGTWEDGDRTCFRCQYGPAVLSATYGVVADDAAARRRAVQSFDLAIKQHQAKDGSFDAPGVPDGPGIQTMLFGVLLGQTYLALGHSLDDKTAATWRGSMGAAAHYLHDAGWTRWYANGNLVLGETVFFELTAKIVGGTWYASQAEQLYQFLVAPPQDRWPGFGLVYSKRPTAPDGSDGSAFLAEKGSGAPGFDAAYGMFQLALATAWWVYTDDPRAERLTNLLLNQLLPRVRQSDWTIDIDGGTRRGGAGVRYGFTNPGLPVLALGAGRTDLLGAVLPQAAVRAKTDRDATGFSNPGNSYGFGIELAALLWDLR